jgi:hypothetical protein
VSTAQLERTLVELAELPRTAMIAATRAVERIARDVGAQAGPMRLGRRRIRLRAVSKLKGGGADVTATVYGTPTGAWVMATSGTRAHTIAPKTRRGRKTRFLKGAGYPHPIGRPVRHPGSRGRRAWNRVIERAETEVPNIFLEQARKVMR